MRVAVIYFPVKNKLKLQNITKGLVAGIECQGHHVDLIDGTAEVGKKLTIYQYIALGTESTTFYKGTINPKVNEFLAQAGALIGKKCFAFLAKATFAAEKTLLTLMKAMEKEGMVLKTSDILSDSRHARAIGEQLHIA